MSSFRHAAAHIRPVVRVAPARLATGAGLRAAVALGVPLVVGYVAGQPMASFGALAGFLVTLADKGGSYRNRARATGALTLTAALAVALGALAAGSPWVAPAAMFAVAAAGGLAQAFGVSAGSVGTSTSIVFAASLAYPAAAEGALLRGALALAGGLWAMLLALGLWPLRPYKPARAAIAACYRALASLADDVARDFGETVAPSSSPEISGDAADNAERHARLGQHAASLRASIEGARSVLAATRRGRIGETPRGERLIVLLEASDQLLGVLLAVTEVFPGGRPGPESPDAREAARVALAACAETSRAIADAVEREGVAGTRLLAPIVPARRPGAGDDLAIGWGEGALREAVDRASAEGAIAADSLARRRFDHLALLVSRLREFAAAAAETAGELESGETPSARRAPREALRQERASFAETLRDNLTARSVVFRHAARVGLTTAVAVALTHAFGVARGQWVTIAAIVVLQPYSGATTLKGIQRVVGTVLGCALTALIAALVHSEPGVLALVFALAAAGVAIMPFNYAAYSALTTATFVLLAEVSVGDWHLVTTRVANTLAGGALAYAATRLLWPAPERERLPELLAGSLRASADYLRLGVASLAAGEGGAVPAARRALGLATINAEASFERLVAESPWDSDRLQPIMALLTYNRRLARAVTALLEAPGARAEDLARLSAFAAGEIEVLADAVAEGRSPRPLADFDAGEAAGGPALRAAVEGTLRRLRVLHASAVRLASVLR